MKNPPSSVPSPSGSRSRQTWDERLYDELRTLAHRQMADESGARTLQSTALLHEAWLRMAQGSDEPSSDGATTREPVEFRARAATVMRRVRIDAARQRRAARRDVGRRVVFDNATQIAQPEERDDYVVALDIALDRLVNEDPELARLVELRFFGCCELDEIASVMHLSERTVKRRWQLAKGWLHREIMREVSHGI